MSTVGTRLVGLTVDDLQHRLNCRSRRRASKPKWGSLPGDFLYRITSKLLRGGSSSHRACHMMQLVCKEWRKISKEVFSRMEIADVHIFDSMGLFYMSEALPELNCLIV